MKLLGCFAFVLGVSQAIAVFQQQGCSNIIGIWRNELNSNLTIESVTGDVFTGTFGTGVGRDKLRFPSKVSGVVKTAGNGKLIGFTVLWNKGAYLATWVGECIVCNGQEKFYTTWILRTYEPSPGRWMSTQIDENTYWRTESTLPNQVPQSYSRYGPVSSSGIQGNWRSKSGDSFDIIEVQQQGTWQGTYGNGPNGEFATGIFDGNQSYTALGFIAASSYKIKGWTGHIYDPDLPTKVLETSWIEHTFNQDCTNPRKTVNFGVEEYSKF